MSGTSATSKSGQTPRNIVVVGGGVQACSVAVSCFYFDWIDIPSKVFLTSRHFSNMFSPFENNFGTPYCLENKWYL